MKIGVEDTQEGNEKDVHKYMKEPGCSEDVREKGRKGKNVVYDKVEAKLGDKLEDVSKSVDGNFNNVEDNNGSKCVTKAAGQNCHNRFFFFAT